jgi:hypothetical protein
MLAVGGKDSATKRMLALEPGKIRSINDLREDTDASAGWDMHSQEIDALLSSPDNAKYKTSLEAWKNKISSWKTGANSAAYLRAFRASRISNPQMLLGTAVEPKYKFGGN